jgi:predicted glycosyltransferase
MAVPDWFELRPKFIVIRPVSVMARFMRATHGCQIQVNSIVLVFRDQPSMGGPHEAGHDEVKN